MLYGDEQLLFHLPPAFFFHEIHDLACVSILIIPDEQALELRHVLLRDHEQA